MSLSFSTLEKTSVFNLSILLDVVEKCVNVLAKKKTSQVNSYSSIIIIITLFQEDNVFGVYASLTYGRQLIIIIIIISIF